MLDTGDNEMTEVEEVLVVLDVLVSLERTVIMVMTQVA